MSILSNIRFSFYRLCHWREMRNLRKWIKSDEGNRELKQFLKELEEEQ